MKTILNLVAAALLCIGCDAFRAVTKNDITAQGSPYELIVVSEHPQWDGALGDSLRRVLNAPIPYLQQNEPHFDLLRVNERGFDNLVLKHRNILITDIDPSAEETSADVEYNVYATPQIVVTITGPTEESIATYVGKYGSEIVQILERAERDRDIAYAEKFNVEQINKLIESKFGFEMKVPKGYTIRNEAEDFVWISYEFPTSSQGFFVYQYKATQGAKALTLENLLKARNHFAAQIPGPSEGSYMTTYADYEPDYRLFKLEGRVWAELRGFWEVENDFMGGPFVSYSTLDLERGMVVTIDGYVFSPKLGKRNFIRGVEHLIYNVKFPE